MTNPTDATLEDVHTYFGLSYANYLVLPRTLLQSMSDEWQTQFVTLLNQMHDAFEHVPQAATYQVTAGKTMQLDEMTESQLYAAGIIVEGDGQDGPGPETRYHRGSDGAELTGQDYGFVPGEDPVPHYNRGRSRVEPRLGGGRCRRLLCVRARPPPAGPHPPSTTVNSTSCAAWPLGRSIAPSHPTFS